ncbi:MAG: acetyl-CoA carboxylase biotin carboxyl carrier protein subunit, partial [Clostridia bacterium]|nr:acetyl-CoA carboxylase biotin carboxyl carrier protein subunit [Clostridia bacterium]
PFIAPTFSSETQSKEEKPLVRITAPVDGSIVKVSVKPGDHITMGDPLCVIEAMQMKNTLPAPKTGIIEEVFVAPGLSVEAGAVLFTLR